MELLFLSKNSFLTLRMSTSDASKTSLAEESTSSYVKKSRENTKEEKRRMRAKRKKKLRKCKH